jgi:hypothetical protein
LGFYKQIVSGKLAIITCVCVLPRSWRGVLDTTLCDKVFQWLRTGQWLYYINDKIIVIIEGRLP